MTQIPGGQHVADPFIEINRRLDTQAAQINELVRRDVYVAELNGVKADISEIKETLKEDRIETRRERLSTRNLVLTLSVMIVLSLIANGIVIFRVVGP